MKAGQVKLEFSNTSMLLDMPPLTPYELYARGYTRETKGSISCQVLSQVKNNGLAEMWSGSKEGS